MLFNSWFKEIHFVSNIVDWFSDIKNDNNYLFFNTLIMQNEIIGYCETQ